MNLGIPSIPQRTRHQALRLVGIWLLVLAAIGWASSCRGASNEYFGIHVVDEATGRGVPLTELRTTNDIVYYTDSSGNCAFFEPGLMNHKVFFTITSPGYEFEADGFGYRGKALLTTPGSTITLKIRRVNVAERLFRLTGTGIYRDSLLLGQAAPTSNPLLNGDVVGQDSVLAMPYKGKIYWFWGDTGRPEYPLGHFGMAGATTRLGEDPDTAVNLNYFVDGSGFSRPMMPVKDPGPMWLTGIFPIENGTKLVGWYSRMKDLGTAYERGLALYNDEKQIFERQSQFDALAMLPFDGHPFLATEQGKPYLVGSYVGSSPIACVRIAPRLSDLSDLNAYERYTCLKPGCSEAAPVVDRDANGKVIYAWKRNAPCLTGNLQDRLVSAGLLKADECLFVLKDILTGAPVVPHGGSLYWNAYRHKWISIFGQFGGSESMIGEIWYAESDTPVGPWGFARKVASHPKMDFYNPTQHPFFDRERGKLVYFEGTYVNTFSGNPLAVPRYNYNQILYRLDLSDPRLAMPSPVYRMKSGGYRMAGTGQARLNLDNIAEIAFLAISPELPHEGLIPIYNSGGRITSSPDGNGSKVLAYILSKPKENGPATLPIAGQQGSVIGYAWASAQRVLTADFQMIDSGASK